MSSESYRLEIEGWIRDRSKVDAWQLRLRAWHGDQYFQFFTVPVPGVVVALEVEPHGRSAVERFKGWLALEATFAVQEAIRDGLVPLENPTEAFELFIDPERAARRAKDDEDPPLKRTKDGRVVGRRFMA